MNQTLKRYLVRILRYSAVVLAVASLTDNTALACPPHPSLLEARAAAEAAGETVCRLPSTSEMHARGIGLPEDAFGLNPTGKGSRGQAATAGPFRILCLLVDFSDHTAQVATSFFDNHVFGTGTGTVHDYFDEISYGLIDLVTVNLPSSIGWTRAPQTYAYYVDNQYGMGSYPQNSQGLVEDAVDAVDALVDFSVYDNDSDGYVDILLVVHTGTGAELSGNAADMWSHKWGINRRLTGEGVYVSAFTVQPEFWTTPGDMTIGVYSHELIHGFGLPDLYDTDDPDVDFVSNGIGRWGIMSYGSWNGTLGSSPAHPCAWSRIQMGISTPVNVTANISQQAIPSVNSGGSIYRLWSSGAASNEHFLVENRQRTGYETTLPSSGLFIWHIDDNKTTNQDEWYPGLPGSHHLLVALEQADGLYELEHATGLGDGADPWPGSLNRTTFSGATSPSSDSYLSGGSFVAVDNISASAATMYADLIVGVAASTEDEDIRLPNEFSLSQNYPNPFNPTTTIEFSLLSASDVRLDIYNLLGQHVSTLIDKFVDAGLTRTTWDGIDRHGSKAASGAYFYELIVEGDRQTKKMLLVK